MSYRYLTDVSRCLLVAICDAKHTKNDDRSIHTVITQSNITNKNNTHLNIKEALNRMYLLRIVLFGALLAEMPIQELVRSSPCSRVLFELLWGVCSLSIVPLHILVSLHLFFSCMGYSVCLWHRLGRFCCRITAVSAAVCGLTVPGSAARAAVASLLLPVLELASSCLAVCLNCQEFELGRFCAPMVAKARPRR